MLGMNMEIEDFTFKDINKDELDKVLKIYNDTNDSMFATGVNKPLSMEDMEEKYLEVLVSNHEFFIGIFTKPENKLIGILKGRIDYDNSDEAWINSFIIKEDFRNKGIGSKTIKAFMSFMKKTYDINSFFVGVISKNTKGISFWIKAGFKQIRTIERYIDMNNAFEDLIVLRKEI